MPRPILHLLMLSLLAVAGAAQARTATARIARITTPVATLRDVEVRLDWADGAPSGDLRLHAAAVDAADLGYRFRDVAWRCPLSRTAPDGWRCRGALVAAGGRPMRLDVDLATATTEATLARGGTRLVVRRDAATPDDTTIDLMRVPLAWAQALSSQAWAAGQWRRGTLDGRLQVRTPVRGPLRIGGALSFSEAALDTPDATVAVDKLGGRVQIDYRKFPATSLLSLDGTLRGGELLFGSSYVALPATPVQWRIDAMQRGGEGWRLPSIAWHDGAALDVSGAMAFTAGGDVDASQLEARSDDLSALPARYLSGWLGVAGLAGLQLQGAMTLSTAMSRGTLSSIDARLHDVAIRDAADRFAFRGLDGGIAYSSTTNVDSTLRWSSGSLAAIPFGAGTLPWRSADGILRTRDVIAIPILGGSARLQNLQLQPPSDGHGLRIESGLALENLELGTLSQSLGGPAFRGTLAGTIPLVRYADDRIDFDGGLAMQVFGGRIDVSALAMERPFGTAPSLSADIALHDLDLMAITETFDVGSISGRLDGRIGGLRLVDWSATAFDADLHTVPRRGVRQRISQRAVQSISSVGGGSLVDSLQGRAIALFDDFGYARIGIACRLANEICAMRGLRSAGDTFTIVDGAGLPRLQVVGIHRSVDWPTLLERLIAASKGDVKPVFK